MRQVHEGIRMKLATLFLLTATLQAAAISGIVLNGSTDKPQPGATVTLFKVGGNGPETIESVKTDSSGKFSIDKELPGPRLLQAAFDGVTYNQMLPPGAPANAVTIKVYPSSKKPGSARVDQHMMLLEPTPNNTLNVSETFVWNNDGKTTFNDPDHGTLEFYLDPAANGQVEVNALAPQGMPIRRAAEKTNKPNIYKIDFPIKPGQSRIDLGYQMPFTSPGEFKGKILYKGGPTRVVAPQGVTMSGAGVQDLGAGPQNTTIYGIDVPDFALAITGTGVLRGEAGGDQGGGDQGGGQSISQIMPKLYGAGSPNATFWETLGAVKWIVSLTFAILALGFTLLYRVGSGQIESKAKSGSNRR
jgi:hypothetical protein